MPIEWNPKNYFIFSASFNFLVSKLATKYVKHKSFNPSSQLIYLSTNDLQWFFIKIKDKPCIMFCGNNTNVLSYCWHVFINWNDFVMA
jgi:hypothetical protein